MRRFKKLFVTALSSLAIIGMVACGSGNKKGGNTSQPASPSHSATSELQRKRQHRRPAFLNPIGKQRLAHE